MKRITDMELRELPFGTQIKIIWHNSRGHDKNEEHLGVIFGNKIGWENGETNAVKMIAGCMRINLCMVYQMS